MNEKMALKFALWLALGLGSFAGQAQQRSQVLTGDYIVAVVNQELVTAGEVQSRLTRVRENASRSGASLPPADQLRQQVVDLLIEERVQITYARESGQRLDDVELDRAVTNVAVQNQITLGELRERLRKDGIEFARFRNNVRDQILTERVREREVLGRIRISDAELDAYLEQRRAASARGDQFDIAQVLITVPEGALGAKIEVPTVEGKAQLRIPPGTQSGQKFRLRQRGAPSLRNPGARGDQFVEVQVTLPKVISEETKELLRQYSKLNDENPRVEMQRRDLWLPLLLP